MISLLLKNWKLFLDIILVVAAIVLFSILDPFKMFSKRQLNDTANLVSQVRSIGELVTAEYYGEVIGSSKESYTYTFPADTLTQKSKDLYLQIKELCIESYLKHGNKPFYNILNRDKDVLDHHNFSQLETVYSAHDVYKYTLLKIATELIRGKNRGDYIKKNGEFKGFGEKQKIEKDVVQAMLKDLKDVWQNHKKKKKKDFLREKLYKTLGETPHFLDNMQEYIAQQTNIDYRSMHETVFIGRGSVKAGFRFDRLDEHNFVYNAATKTIHFYGLSADVLDHDINPWFIPEKKIKGYELVEFKRKTSFKEANRVKKICRTKLLEQAEHAGIIEQARINGIETLERFFSLLMNETTLKVQLHDFPHHEEIHMIATDSLITIEEGITISSIFDDYKTLIKSSRHDSIKYSKEFELVYNELAQLDFIEEGHKFNLYSPEAAKLLSQYKKLTVCDIRTFEDSIRGTLFYDSSSNVLTTDFIKDSPLFMDYQSFSKDYNETIALLKQELNTKAHTELIQHLNNADEQAFARSADQNKDFVILPPFVLTDSLDDISSLIYNVADSVVVVDSNIVYKVSFTGLQTSFSFHPFPEYTFNKDSLVKSTNSTIPIAQYSKLVKNNITYCNGTKSEHSQIEKYLIQDFKTSNQLAPISKVINYFKEENHD